MNWGIITLIIIIIMLIILIYLFITSTKNDKELKINELTNSKIIDSLTQELNNFKTTVDEKITNIDTIIKTNNDNLTNTEKKLKMDIELIIKTNDDNATKINKITDTINNEFAQALINIKTLQDEVKELTEVKIKDVMAKYNSLDKALRDNNKDDIIVKIDDLNKSITALQINDDKLKDDLITSALKINQDIKSFEDALSLKTDNKEFKEKLEEYNNSINVKINDVITDLNKFKEDIKNSTNDTINEIIEKFKGINELIKLLQADILTIKINITDLTNNNKIINDVIKNLTSPSGTVLNYDEIMKNKLTPELTTLINNLKNDNGSFKYSDYVDYITKTKAEAENTIIKLETIFEENNKRIYNYYLANDIKIKALQTVINGLTDSDGKVLTTSIFELRLENILTASNNYTDDKITKLTSYIDDKIKTAISTIPQGPPGPATDFTKVNVFNLGGVNTLEKRPDGLYINYGNGYPNVVISGPVLVSSIKADNGIDTSVVNSSYGNGPYLVKFPTIVNSGATQCLTGENFMHNCSDTDLDQKWYYDNITGLLRNKQYQKCLSGTSAGFYLKDCNSNDLSQRISADRTRLIAQDPTNYKYYCYDNGVNSRAYTCSNLDQVAPRKEQVVTLVPTSK